MLLTAEKIDVSTYPQALHLAAQNGYKGIVYDLLAKEANVNAVDDNGKTPLHLAVQNGHKQMVQALLDKGANVNAVDDNERLLSI